MGYTQATVTVTKQGWRRANPALETLSPLRSSVADYSTHGSGGNRTFVTLENCVNKTLYGDARAKPWGRGWGVPIDLPVSTPLYRCTTLTLVEHVPNSKLVSKISAVVRKFLLGISLFKKLSTTDRYMHRHLSRQRFNNI